VAPNDHAKRPIRGRFGLNTWTVYDILVGGFGFGSFWSIPISTTTTMTTLVNERVKVCQRAGGKHLFGCSVFVIAVADDNVRALATEACLDALKTTVFTCQPHTDTTLNQSVSE